MLDVIQSIADFFIAVWDVCSTIFDGLFEFFSFFGDAASKFADYVSIFPTWITVPLGTMIAGLIIYRIVGRSS